VLLDCVIYCAFYSILFRGAVFSGHGVYDSNKLKETKDPKIKTILLLYWLGSGFEKAVTYLLVPRGRSVVLPFSSFAYTATGQ